MARVEEHEIRAIIQTDSSLSLAPFIEAATALVDYVVTKDDNSILTTALTKSIEKFLSAHFYAHRDQQYTQKKTGDASATFQVEIGLGLNSTQWGQTAMRLDVTGTLASLDNKKRASMNWLGYKKSEQTNYADRD